MSLEIRRARALPLLLILAACSQTTPRPAPRQMRIVGATAALPFTAAAAEDYVRTHADAIAPLVRAAGSGSGIAEFCAGLGPRHPELVATTRAFTASETAACAAHGVGAVIAMPFGWSALVAVTRRETVLTGLTTKALAVALAGPATDWHAIDPALPQLRIDLRGPAPRPETAEGLATLAPHIRKDMYRGYGADAELAAAATAETPGAIGLVPYATALVHADALKTLPLDGVAPDAATIAAGRYPLRLPLTLYAKAGERDAVPGLGALMRGLAAAAAPGGLLAGKGLVPLDDAARAEAARHVVHL